MQVGAPIGDRRASVPESGHSAGQPKAIGDAGRLFGILGADPGQGRVDIGIVGLQSVEIAALDRPAALDSGRQVGEVVQMRTSGGAEGTALLESIHGEMADRFKQAKPPTTVGGRGRDLDQAVIDERADRATQSSGT